MEIRSDAILYSKLGNENSDEGGIKCSRGPQVPYSYFTTPWVVLLHGLVLQHDFACDILLPIPDSSIMRNCSSFKACQCFLITCL